MTKTVSWKQGFCAAIFTFLTSACAVIASPVVAQEILTCQSSDPVNVDIDKQSQRSNGAPIKVTWRQRTSNPEQPCPSRFLVIAVPEGVRFSGEGFVALPARAPTPLGINVWPDRTRAIVPLNLGPLTQTGTLYIKPSRAGRLRVSWKVVGLSGQSITETDPRDVELDVKSGSPQLSIEDPYFSGGQVKQSLISNDDSAQIDDYGQYFRVTNHHTFEQIYQASGHSPHFSPTGRYIYYLAARSASGEADSVHFEIYDRASGTVVLSRDRTADDGVGQNAIVSVRWGVGDAFVSLGFAKAGGLETYQLLIDRKPYSVQLGANCCTAVEERASMSINLDALLGSYTNKDPDFNEVGQSLLAFSDDGLKTMLDPDATTRLAALKTAEEANPGVVPLGQRSDELEETLSKQATDYIKRFAPLARHRDQVFSLTASNKWDSGDKPVRSRNDAASTAKRPLTISRSLDQLIARPFDQIPASRQGVLNRDRFAQRLQDFGLTLSTPIPSTSYLAPKPGPDGEIPTTWLNDMTKSVPGMQKLVGHDAHCNALEELPGGGGIDLQSTYSARVWKANEITVWLVAEGCSTSPSVSDFFIRFALIVQRAGELPKLIRLNDKMYKGVSVDKSLSLQTAPFPAPAPVADLIDGRYLLLAFADQPAVAEFDLVANSVIILKGEKGVYGAASQIYRTSDGRIIRLDRDGGFHVYTPASRRGVIQGRYVDDELVFYDANGYFDGTDEGSRYVYLRFPGLAEPVSLRQFRATLHDTTLITQMLAQSDPPPPLQLVAPPSATLALIDSAGPSETTSALISADSTTELKEARLYIDGRLIQTKSLSGLSAKLRVDIPHSGHWFTVQVVDGVGTESMPVSVQIPQISSSPNAKSQLFVIAVGTNTYDDPRIQHLDGPVNDAKTFANLASNSPLYMPGVRPVLLIDDRDLRGSLIQTIESIAHNATVGDTVMLQISGHGMRTNDGRLFLATRTTRVDDLENTALPWTEVAAALGHVKARVIVFLDACHSGAAGSDRANDIAASSLVAGSDSIIILSASKGRQLSLERAGAGFFTSALDKLVRRNARTTDTNGNKIIELDELYRSLKIEVLQLSQGRQTPWVARNGMVGPVPLF